MGKVTGNLELIKKVNRALVLETIKDQQSISRANIAKKLGLSRSTVSTIVDELLDKKLVVELGYGDSTKLGGRRSVQLGFNPDSSYGIGLDIGGTKILIVITNMYGEIVYKEKLETTNKIEEIISLVNEGLDKSEIDKEKILAMGVGVPSATNSKEGIVIDAPALKWSNFNLKKELQDQFDFPIFIDNDVNCAALGEKWKGSGKNIDNMFFIAIGTGVGSAVISNGELVRGYNYEAGEIAYNISESDVKNGLMNKVGEFGVFESKISGTALHQKGYSPSQLFKEYSKGNEEVFEVIDNFILQLSINITNAVNLLNPESVIIGGGVSESLDLIIDQIQDKVDMLSPVRTNVKLAQLRGDAGALGAIAYALKRVEESEVWG